MRWLDFVNIAIIIAGWETGRFICNRIERWWNNRTPKYAWTCSTCLKDGLELRFETNDRSVLNRVMDNHYDLVHNARNEIG